MSEQTRFNRQPSALYSHSFNSIEPQQSKCNQTLHFFLENLQMLTHITAVAI